MTVGASGSTDVAMFSVLEVVVLGVVFEVAQCLCYYLSSKVCATDKEVMLAL